MKTYIFTKENGNWFVNFSRGLKEFNRTEFALVDGAATLLDTLSNGHSSVPLKIDSRPFRKASVLELMEWGHDIADDGHYRMSDEKGNVLQPNVCLSELTLLVFGDIPDRFYVYAPVQGEREPEEVPKRKRPRVFE